MHIFQKIFERNRISEPDGRPLHRYLLTDEEFAELRNFLSTRSNFSNLHPNITQAFVLWASEYLRRHYKGGILSWQPIFTEINRPCDQEIARNLVEKGLHQWQRKLRLSKARHREFLYSLLAEGGLPDCALAEAPKYRNALFHLIHRIETEGTLAKCMAEEFAMQAIMNLPHVLQTSEQALLLAELAQALVTLRQSIPEDMPLSQITSWLNAQQSNWQNQLPLRLSERALEVLILPALTQERGQPDRKEPLVRRELRWSEEPRGWIGIARIGEGAFLPASALPSSVDVKLRLRLFAEDSNSFIATPIEGGWNLIRSGGRGDLDLQQNPEKPVILAAYADGRVLGNAILDSGHLSPDEIPSLWRASDPADDPPKALVPLSGYGRTRAQRVFLLSSNTAEPLVSDGITVGEPVPGPGGRVWPLSGSGEVWVGDCKFSVATAADSDAPTACLLVLGKTLNGLMLSGGSPVYLGTVKILGSVGEDTLRQLGKNLQYRPLPVSLGAKVVEWREDDVVLARTRIDSLPEGANFKLRDCGSGRMHLTASGLEPGWRLQIVAKDVNATGCVGSNGVLELELSSSVPQASITLHIVDPKTNAKMELHGIWLVQKARIVDQSNRIIDTKQPLSLKRLIGWRGLLPESGGVVQFRLAGEGTAVAVPAQAVERLYVHADLICHALSFTGANGRLHLQLIAQGSETSRLEIGLWDWSSEDAGPFRDLGLGTTRLKAVLLEDPSQTVETLATGRIDLEGWLGKNAKGPWFIQGESDLRGIMYPIIWSPNIPFHNCPETRLGYYAEKWTELLEKPADFEWMESWQRISTVRAAGTAAGLNQVQALARVPAAAAALVLRVQREDRAAALALETEAPLWWPLIRVDDWATAMKIQKSHLREMFSKAGYSEDQIAETVTEYLSRTAGEVNTLRPELAGHIGLAMVRSDELPIAFVAGDRKPLEVPDPEIRLHTLAQELARRFDHSPNGSGIQQAHRLTIDFGLNEDLLSLLHAPLVVAEVALGYREQPKPHEILQLLALRSTDPVWFDAALPTAMSMASKRKEQ